MTLPLTKKRLHESAASFLTSNPATKLRRISSVPQVVPLELSEHDVVAKALIQLKSSIDKNEQMAQWFKRCGESRGNPESSVDNSTSSCCSSRDEIDVSSHQPSLPTPLTPNHIPNHIPIAEILRSKLVKKPSNPDEFVQTLLSMKGRTVQRISAASLSASGYFPKVSDDFVRGYTIEVVSAVRNDDVASLRRIYEQDPSRSPLCGSKFGDSIIHLACRRSSVKVLEYLLCEMNLSPQLVCDYGRTPLHDALWNTKINERVLTLLLNKCPNLLFVTDHRGSSPLSYAPRDQWTFVCRFLAQHMKKFGTFLSPEVCKSDNDRAVNVVPVDSRSQTILEQ